MIHKIRANIPNSITLLNLSMGSISVFISFNGLDLKWAFLMIVIAAIFDFFDGFAARALKAYSDLGKELDSLADLISFGLAPAAILFRLMCNSLGIELYDFREFNASLILPLFSLLIVAFSALRLAKFNIDTAQKTEFIGLPTPANAMFLGSLVFIESSDIISFLLSSTSLIIISVLFSYLLVSKLPMFSFKFSSLKFSEQKYQFIFLGISMILMIILQYKSVFYIMLIYITLNVIRYFNRK